MATKKLQIIDSLIKQAENADTLDGKHADEFATASDVENLQKQIGDETVSTQITTAIEGLATEVYVNDAVSQKTQVQIVNEYASEVLSTFTVHKLTQEEYEQKLADGTLDETTMYLTPDEDIDLSIYATIEQLESKADIGHIHDDINDSIADLNSLIGDTSVSTQIDDAIVNLINGAPTTLDTLGEIATAMEENGDVVAALDSAIGTKANASDLTAHIGNKSNPHSVTLSQFGVTATSDELNYIGGATSNIQTQLNNLSDLIGNETVSVQIITWEADD